jgi:3-oxoacid CoA-transferase subunit A
LKILWSATPSTVSGVVATASRTTIAEVEELVPAGRMAPDEVHLPGIYVKGIFQGKSYEKRIERRPTKQ